MLDEPKDWINQAERGWREGSSLDTVCDGQRDERGLSTTREERRKGSEEQVCEE